MSSLKWPHAATGGDGGRGGSDGGGGNLRGNGGQKWLSE